MTTPAELIACQDALCETGRMFHQRGWSLGTSSNYSVVLQQQPLQLLVTASGKHKGRLTRNDFVQVGADGFHKAIDFRLHDSTAHLAEFREAAVVHCT